MDVQIWSVPGSGAGLVGQMLAASNQGDYGYFTPTADAIKVYFNSKARVIIPLPELKIIRSQWKRSIHPQNNEDWHKTWVALAIVHAASLNAVIVDPFACWRAVTGSEPYLRGAPPENWKVSMIHDSLRSKMK